MLSETTQTTQLRKELKDAILSLSETELQMVIAILNAEKEAANDQK